MQEFLDFEALLDGGQPQRVGQAEMTFCDLHPALVALPRGCDCDSVDGKGFLPQQMQADIDRLEVGGVFQPRHRLGGGLGLGFIGEGQQEAGFGLCQGAHRLVAFNY